MHALHTAQTLQKGSEISEITVLLTQHTRNHPFSKKSFNKK